MAKAVILGKAMAAMAMGVTAGNSVTVTVLAMRPAMEGAMGMMRRKVATGRTMAKARTVPRSQVGRFPGGDLEALAREGIGVAAQAALPQRDLQRHCPWRPLPRP
mmetsp:Transcript_18992/g.35628  ORF Transcript_18992/g.35628 Transcript_18992/m.35628 type:complete len:105 (+) Transcript_18992:634-948(+)